MLNKQAIYEGSQKAVEDEENAKIQAADKQVGSCVICFEAPRTHIFIPCGHMCGCKLCCKKVMSNNKKCPICNKTAMMTTELFFA